MGERAMKGSKILYQKLLSDFAESERIQIFKRFGIKNNILI